MYGPENGPYGHSKWRAPAMLTPHQLHMLRKLSTRMLTFIDLYKKDNNSDLNAVQMLTTLGYARDYGAQKSRRVEVRLRIWGITDAGRALLESQNLGEASARGQAQLGLTLGPKKVVEQKESLMVKRWVRPITTSQLAEIGRQRKAQVADTPEKPQKKQPARKNKLQTSLLGDDDE